MLCRLFLGIIGWHIIWVLHFWLFLLYQHETSSAFLTEWCLIRWYGRTWTSSQDSSSVPALEGVFKTGGWSSRLSHPALTVWIWKWKEREEDPSSQVKMLLIVQPPFIPSCHDLEWFVTWAMGIYIWHLHIWHVKPWRLPVEDISFLLLPPYSSLLIRLMSHYSPAANLLGMNIWISQFLMFFSFLSSVSSIHQRCNCNCTCFCWFSA